MGLLIFCEIRVRIVVGLVSELLSSFRQVVPAPHPDLFNFQPEGAVDLKEKGTLKCNQNAFLTAHN